LYADDLDVFGKGSLFESLCTARTRSGQETLAQWLLQPASRGEILRRQEAIRELRDNVDLRECLAVFGPQRAAIDFDLAAEWSRQPRLLPAGAPRIIALFLVICTIAAITAWFWFRIGAWVPSLAVVAQMGFALYYRKRVQEVVLSINEPAGELGLLAVPLRRLEYERFSSAKLHELKDALDTGGMSASHRIASMVGLARLLEYRRDPSVGLFLPILLWSTQIAFAAEAWRSRYGKALQEWMAAIGLVTTHDLALATVADALKPIAANVHFEDHLENGEMIFDYCLHAGVIRRSNALELMRAIGLKV
jgi:hypothetical protein